MPTTDPETDPETVVHLPVLADPPQVVVTRRAPAAEPPPAGERRVELLVAELQPLDLQIARGQLPGVADGVQPGSSAVAVTATGDRVAVLGGAVGLGTARPGCFASRFDVPEAALVAVPDGVDAEVVAAGLSATMAATVALEDHAQLRRGERVLVLGASGAVGRAAAGLAHAAEAEVVALARDTSRLTDLPPAVRAGPLEALERPGSLGRFDVVVDTLGGGWTAAAARLGAPRCRHALLGYAAGVTATIVVPSLLANEHRLLAVNLHATPLPRLREVAAGSLTALADRRVRPTVGPRVPLADAARAYELAAAGHRPLLLPV